MALTLLVVLPSTMRSQYLATEADTALTELGIVVGLGHIRVLLERTQIMHIQLDRLLALVLAAGFTNLITLLLGLFKRLLIHGQPAFLGHDPGQVAGEAKGIV